MTATSSNLGGAFTHSSGQPWNTTSPNIFSRKRFDSTVHSAALDGGEMWAILWRMYWRNWYWVTAGGSSSCLRIGARSCGLLCANTVLLDTMASRAQKAALIIALRCCALSPLPRFSRQSAHRGRQGDPG